MKRLVLILLLLTSTAQAAPRQPLPESEWTDEAKLWLSRAVVAEANWTAPLDFTLIAWTLTYRWRERLRREPTVHFVDVVRRYCAGLSEKAPVTPRQRWVRNLPPLDTDVEPLGWPGLYSWTKHLTYWRRVQQHIEEWGQGQHRDITRGRVWHWGSPSEELPDLAKAIKAIHEKRWVLLHTPGTLNLFYGRAR